MNKQNRYLELLKSSLLNEIYLADEQRIYYLLRCLEGKDQYSYSVLHAITSMRPEMNQEYLRSREIGQFPHRDIKNCGFSHSMIGRKRLNSLHECLDVVQNDKIPGDFIECGVWRGGASIFMKGYLDINGINSRKVFIADSFEGLPKPDQPDEPDLSPECYPQLAVSLDEVLNNFAAYDLLDEHVVPLQGWFSDTLATAPVDHLAILRADGDYYSSTTDILENLYDKVSTGGFVIIDDYGVLSSCKRAVIEFFERRSQPMPRIEKIDWSGVFWRKE